MARAKQLTLFKEVTPPKLFIPQAGRRKERRPLSTRLPMHLILKSQQYDLKKNERRVLGTWNQFATRFGIKCYRLVVNHDHVHAVVRIRSRDLYAKFIQALSGTLAKVLKIKWRMRPVTRLAQWGRDFKRLCRYMELNFLEANGFIDYRPQRTRRLPEWLKLGP